MGKKISILAVDDSQVIREGLQCLLGHEEDMEVVGAIDGKEALSQVEKLSPDIVLMDIKMPGVDGIKLTKQLKEKFPSCKVIMLSLYDEYLPQAMKAGASGYLLKDIKGEELTQAIRYVQNGDVVISGAIPYEIRDKYIGKKAGEDPDAMSEVQLVIPPIEPKQLIGFVSHLEEMLECSVWQMVSSWPEGTAVIFSLRKSAPLADILNKLAEMPEVEAIVEKPPPNKTLLTLLQKAAGLSKINPKTILVTLKQG